MLHFATKLNSKGGVGWGGVGYEHSCSLTHWHTSGYARVIFCCSCTQTSRYARVIFSCSCTQTSRYAMMSLHEQPQFWKSRLIILRCHILTWKQMNFSVSADEIGLVDKAWCKYMGKRRKMNMQMAAEHDYLNPSNKKQILWCKKRRGFLCAWSLKH